MESLIVLALVGAVYFTPSIIAINRKVPNESSIVVVNLFLGWTLIGWVVALALAVRDTEASVARRKAAVERQRRKVSATTREP